MSIMDFGKNAVPRFVSERTRPDGRRSVVYGNTLVDGDRIGNPHGHSSHQGSTTLFARTIGQRVLVDRRD